MAYRNPIIPGFHPDPSICRLRDEYFLATSTFTWFPGVPIFRSTDLTNWTQIGNALDRSSQLDLAETDHWSSSGIYAPTLRHHDGRFWMITTLATSGGLTNFFVTADDPAGPWSDPVTVPVIGIDPDMCWDDEGRCWIHFAAFGEIQRCQIDDTSGERVGKVETTWSGTGFQFPEAPHLYRIGDDWYLMIAEGGTERGHCVSIARGPTPEGPWESCPHNPILSHRSTGLPIQNTGHADLVEAGDGSWWMVLLGIRPHGLTPGWHVLGRETFLTAVEFRDGWPLVASVELEPAAGPAGAATTTDWSYRSDFDEEVLDASWLARRGEPQQIADLSSRPGWLTIADQGGSLDDLAPSFVGRRQQHLTCRARTMVGLVDGEAGLAVVMDEHAHYAVAVDGSRVLVRLRIGPVMQVVAEAPRPSGHVTLVVETDEHVVGPDRVRLGFEDEAGDLVVLAEPDGRYIATESASGFIGRVIGLYASGGTAGFDWFDYHGSVQTDAGVRSALRRSTEER